MLLTRRDEEEEAEEETRVQVPSFRPYRRLHEIEDNHCFVEFDDP